MTGREALAGSAFTLTAASQDGGPSVALWGRGASQRFSGRDGPLTVDGEVTSATLGADWRSGRWLAGAMVSHSLGEGSYSGDGGAGEVENTLTGVYPYAAYDVSERVTAWAAAGLGEGTLTLTPKNPATGEDDPAMETDMSLGLAALGARGALLEPAAGSGLRLDLETDAFWVRTSSEAAPGLAKAEADVTRLRLGLDGGYAFALAGGATLEPTFELGLRHDGGDAETGYGVDVGAGLRWADPALGLSAEVSGRGLLAHEAAGLSDRGVSGSLAWDPDPATERGPSLTLTQTLGAQAAGGGRRGRAARAPDARGPRGQRRRVRGAPPGADARLRPAGGRRALHRDARARARAVRYRARVPPRLEARPGAQQAFVVRARHRGDAQGARERPGVRGGRGGGARCRGEARGEVLMGGGAPGGPR